MILKKQELEVYEVEKLSEFRLHNNLFSKIHIKNFRVHEIPLDGEAPKDFIFVYEYKERSGIRRNNPKTWVPYIAKVARKHYATESIMEFLLNRLGEVFGLKMAESKLVVISNQIRFLSKYFLKEGEESLIHGAQIYSAYLNDKDFVTQIEEERLSRDFFTLKFTEDAISHMFPESSALIIKDLIRLLVFDALVGNNDRHYYNWGVIVHVSGKIEPRFSPIYDTARGLLWNQEERKLVRFLQDSNHLKHYLKKSLPKIGLENEQDVNHFDLFKKIYSKEEYRQICIDVLSSDRLDNAIDLIDKEFSAYVSINRKKLIKNCLVSRFTKLNKIMKKGV